MVEPFNSLFIFEEKSKWSLFGHNCFVLFVGFAVFWSLLTLVPDVSIQIFNNSSKDLDASQPFFLEEKRPFEPEVIVIIVVVGFFAKASHKWNSILHFNFLRTQLQQKCIFILDLHFVLNLRLASPIEGIDSFEHGQDVKNKLAWLSFEEPCGGFQPLFLVWFFVLEGHPFGLLFAVIEDYKIFHQPRHRFFRNGQRNRGEWVKRDGLLVTVWADHFGLILPSHQVHNDRLVPRSVSFPTLISHDLVFSPIAFHWFNVWFFLHSIQILMKPVNQKREKLLGVMLCVSREHRVDCTHSTFQIVWGESWFRFAPHIFDEFGIRFGELSLCA